MQFVNKQKWFYQRFSKCSRKIKLGFNNLYIFPNKFGFYWIFTCALLYILGTNLEANFTVLFSYLMIIILLINLFLTHFNLHGLELISTDQDINFAESDIKYIVSLKSTIKRHNLILEFINEKVAPLKIDVFEGNILGYINSQNKKRGIFNPGVILGKSSAPMSLFNCWFYWIPTEKIIVAPKIKKSPRQDNFFNRSNEESGRDLKMVFGDELLNLKKYQIGERSSLINWKYYAKSNKLTSKEFVEPAASTKILTLKRNYPLEDSLRYLCFEIHREYNNGNSYGVEISEKIYLRPNKGKKHYHASMIMLACYGR